jgi:hypothetical protein
LHHCSKHSKVSNIVTKAATTFSPFEILAILSPAAPPNILEKWRLFFFWLRMRHRMNKAPDLLLALIRVRLVNPLIKLALG